MSFNSANGVALRAGCKFGGVRKREHFRVKRERHLGAFFSVLLMTVLTAPNCLAQNLPLQFPLTLSIPDGAIVPFLARRNDLALLLDLGLGHQIDSFFPEISDESEKNDWPAPAALGGPCEEIIGSLSSHATDAETFSFSTSLRQSRGLPSRYGLGAGQRPAKSNGPGTFNMWAEGYYYSFDQNGDAFDSDGHAGVLYVGTDYLVSPHLLVGALVQFDDTEQKLSPTAAHVSDTGWMAGPYAMVRLSQNLFFQARAAWGTSDNEIRADPGLDDDFDTDRFLVKGTLLGRWQSGPWQFNPRASVGYIKENQDAYTSSLGMNIPSHTVSGGQAKLGQEIAYRYRMAEGIVIEPSLLLEGIWNFEQSSGSLIIDDQVMEDGVRGRVEAGLALIGKSGISVAASLSYDGIGSSDLEALGGKLRVRAPLN